METITEIKEVTNVGVESDYLTWDGYEITTTEQKIKLIISNYQSCCEDWGYFITNDNPDDFIGANLIAVSIADTSLNTKKLDDEFPYGFDGGGVIFINIETSKGVLQFTAYNSHYNSHNGYYGHTVRVESKQLNHEDVL